MQRTQVPDLHRKPQRAPRFDHIRVARLDPTVGELLDARMPDGGTLRFLRVRCGTGREFALSVPPTMRTAREANAWTYGLTQETYELEART